MLLLNTLLLGNEVVFDAHLVKRVLLSANKQPVVGKFEQVFLDAVQVFECEAANRGNIHVAVENIIVKFSQNEHAPDDKSKDKIDQCERGVFAKQVTYRWALSELMIRGQPRACALLQMRSNSIRTAVACSGCIPAFMATSTK